MVEKNKDLIWVPIILLVLMGVLPVLIWGFGGWYPLGMMGMMGYGSGFMFLIPIVFLALVMVGIYYFVPRSPTNGRTLYNHDQNALEILKERYARGEITREQYLRMKGELEL